MPCWALRKEEAENDGGVDRLFAADSHRGSLESAAARKGERRLIYALWGVVLLRLLVPFSLDWKLPSAEGAARTAYERTELSEAMLPYDSVSAPYAAGYSRSVLPEDDPIQPYLDAGRQLPSTGLSCTMRVRLRLRRSSCSCGPGRRCSPAI